VQQCIFAEIEIEIGEGHVLFAISLIKVEIKSFYENKIRNCFGLQMWCLKV